MKACLALLEISLKTLDTGFPQTKKCFCARLLGIPKSDREGGNNYMHVHLTCKNFYLIFITVVNGNVQLAKESYIVETRPT